MAMPPHQPLLPAVAPLLAAAALALSACGDGDATVPPEARVRNVVQVVPFASPPDGVETQPGNNNLDVALHDGRVFLAFRTAPNHFASDQTMLYVVSSSDQGSWRYEGSFDRDTDLREPRLLSYGGELFLYFAVLGTDSMNFEPQGSMVSAYRGPDDWSEPEWFYLDEFIPWRAKVVDGVPYLIGYVGGGNIYEFSGEPLAVHWLTTDDGKDWTAAVPGQPVVQEGGGSETDFVLLDDGSLIAVMRNEAGDETGWGSKICRAEAGALGDWSCVGDKKKYDSPLLFRDGDAVWLVGRRHLTETGNYDLDRDELSHEEQTLLYEIEYSLERKRCSLWRVDPETLDVAFEFDLPSKGDTCFASMLPGSSPGVVTVYNYSNPLDTEGDPSWLVGQGQPTIIYRADVVLR